MARVNTPQVTVYLGREFREQVDKAAANAGISVSDWMRGAVTAYLGAGDGAIREDAQDGGRRTEASVSSDVTASPKLSLEERIQAVLGEPRPPFPPPAPFPPPPPGSPVAPSLSAVPSIVGQRQGERCYHFDGNEGVTRWHLVTVACPAGTSWAARLEAADMEVDINGKKVVPT